jgi:hypothetical protein
MTNFVPGELWVTLYLGEGYWLAGDADRATRTLQQCLQLGERCRMTVFIGCAHRLLGEIAASSDAVESQIPLAVSHLDQSITIFTSINAENELALSDAAYGRVCTTESNSRGARPLGSRASDIREAWHISRTRKSTGRSRQSGDPVNVSDCDLALQWWHGRSPARIRRPARR